MWLCPITYYSSQKVRRSIYTIPLYNIHYTTILQCQNGTMPRGWDWYMKHILKSLSITGVVQGNLQLTLPPNPLDLEQTQHQEMKSWTHPMSSFISPKLCKCSQIPHPSSRVRGEYRPFLILVTTFGHTKIATQILID